jgi:hypothetical protein
VAVTHVIDSDGRCIEYERRRPETTVLYRIVRGNIQTLFAEAEERSDHGCARAPALPAVVGRVA